MSHSEVKAPTHLISAIHCRVPNLRDLMPDDLRQSWCNNRNKVHNKGYVFESSPNHFPPPPGLWKNWLPWNWSLVPKRLGPAAPMILKQWIHSEIFKYHSYSWLPFLHSKSQPNNYNCIVFPLWKSLSSVWLFVTPWNSPGQNTEVLKCVAFLSSRGSFWPRDGAQVSCIAGGFFTSWATKEGHLHFVWNPLWLSQLRRTPPSLSSVSVRTG